MHLPCRLHCCCLIDGVAVSIHCQHTCHMSYRLVDLASHMRSSQPPTPRLCVLPSTDVGILPRGAGHTWSSLGSIPTKGTGSICPYPVVCRLDALTVEVQLFQGAYNGKLYVLSILAADSVTSALVNQQLATITVLRGHLTKL